MTAFQGAVDATFAAFGTDAVYTPAGGEPVSVRVIARRPEVMPFNRCNLGSEQGLIDDPVLDQGRDPLAPLRM